MRKSTLWLIGFATMFGALGISIVILLLFGETYWSFAPLIFWFVAGQIWLVPKILKK